MQSNNYPTIKELRRAKAASCCFRWGRTYVVEHRLIEEKGGIQCQTVGRLRSALPKRTLAACRW